MDTSVQIFVILMVAGLMLIGAEIFVPGGILGSIGGAALILAIISAFSAFGPVIGGYITLGIVVLLAIVITLWIKLFPKSGIGKQMTVSRDLASSKGTEDGLEELTGKEGEAISELRPAGFASIDGKRVDVVTQGESISKGERVRVVDVEANRVVVRRVDSQNSATVS